MYTVKDIARELGVNVWRVHALVKQKVLPSPCIPGRRAVQPPDPHLWLDEVIEPAIEARREVRRQRLAQGDRRYKYTNPLLTSVIEIGIDKG